MLYDRIDPISDPDGSVADKRDTLCLRRSHSVEMQGDQLGHRIWTGERAVVRRFGFLDHPAFVVVIEDRHEFWFTPCTIECPF